jgi:hypothetical protein
MALFGVERGAEAGGSFLFRLAGFGVFSGTETGKMS